MGVAQAGGCATRVSPCGARGRCAGRELACVMLRYSNEQARFCCLIHFADVPCEDRGATAVGTGCSSRHACVRCGAQLRSKCLRRQQPGGDPGRTHGAAAHGALGPSAAAGAGAHAGRACPSGTASRPHCGQRSGSRCWGLRSPRNCAWRAAACVLSSGCSAFRSQRRLPVSVPCPRDGASWQRAL